MTNKKTKKDFAPSFGFWPTKSGKGFSTQITQELIDLVTANAGGKLFLQNVPAEWIEENSKLPHYRVSVFAQQEQKKEDSDSL